MKIIVSKKLAVAIKRAIIMAVGNPTEEDVFKSVMGSPIITVDADDKHCVISINEEFIIDMVNATQSHIAMFLSLGKSIAFGVMNLAQSIEGVLVKYHQQNQDDDEDFKF